MNRLILCPKIVITCIYNIIFIITYLSHNFMTADGGYSGIVCSNI